MDWERIAELVARYRDMRLGTVDASVVATAERLGTTIDRDARPAALLRRPSSTRGGLRAAPPGVTRRPMGGAPPDGRGPPSSPAREAGGPPGGGRGQRDLGATYTRSRVSDAAPLREQLAGLPTGPGVYIYRDDADRVLYVGKAKSLRRRVLSYFQAPLRPGRGRRAPPMSARGGLHPKIDDLVERIDRVEVFVTGSESEALILEANLVKTHRPPFNVRLRDDKSYPYIGISLDEEYPRVYFTREKHRRDRLYFGPFSNAYKVRETLNLIGKIFPSRPCEGREPGRPSGVPCLDYHIKRCLAPCVGYISREDYRALIDQIIAFLSGRYRGLERELEEEMRAAAAAQEFERAAAVRNRLSAVRHLMERQFATAGSVGTADVLGVAHRRRGGQRPGAPGARRRPPGPPVVLPRHRRAPRTRRRCSCSSPTSTTRWRWRSRRWS